MSVWKMHERRPDIDFLAEVYPKLVRWNEWWFRYRDGNGNGLLEWGDELGSYRNARLETGWDDTQHFKGTEMSGTHMSADAVDLNSIWSLDALYLARIAEALGDSNAAERHMTEHLAINRRINEHLWNEELGTYCSRKWEDNPDGSPSFLTRITPMNFYPLACGAAEGVRAQSVLAWIFDPDKFGGEWILPTLPYDDPDWPKQGYWNGYIWPPPNWIVWQGIKQHADAERRAEYARRCVKLFMKGWQESRICSENYRSDIGVPASHPHYTWGALLPLIGVEALCDIDAGFKPLPYAESGISETIAMRNVPFGGTLYRINCRNGNVEVTKEVTEESPGRS
jgi:putative isomerase